MMDPSRRGSAEITTSEVYLGPDVPSILAPHLLRRKLSKFPLSRDERVEVCYA